MMQRRYCTYKSKARLRLRDAWGKLASSPCLDVALSKAPGMIIPQAHGSLAVLSGRPTARIASSYSTIAPVKHSHAFNWPDRGRIIAGLFNRLGTRR